MQKASFDGWNGTRLLLPSCTIHLMGDPHLGRKFVNDVPIHRRGEREKQVLEAFTANFVAANVLGAQAHVCMGDLFDQPIVDPGVVLHAAETYNSFAKQMKDTLFFVIAGNHDLSRNLEQRTSFDLFTALVRNADNVRVVREKPSFALYDRTMLAFYPWSPVRSAAEMMGPAWFEPGNNESMVAFGHWDVVGPDTNPNLIPIKSLLAENVEIAVTGHDHLCRVEQRGSLNVLVTGSLLPYAHGEDPTGEIYRTLTKAELEATDPAALRDCCVRVMLEPGEEIDVHSVDALQFKVVRKAAEISAAPTVEFESGFDLTTLFDKVMEEGNVSANLRDDLRKRLLAS